MCTCPQGLQSEGTEDAGEVSSVRRGTPGTWMLDSRIQWLVMWTKAPPWLATVSNVRLAAAPVAVILPLASTVTAFLCGPLPVKRQ